MKVTVRGELSLETESGVKISSRMIELLQLVEVTGSLNMAVKELGMSYSYAWNTLYKINCQLETPLLITQRGGKGGGVTFLTDDGKKLVNDYARLKKQFNQFIEAQKNR